MGKKKENIIKRQISDITHKSKMKFVRENRLTDETSKKVFVLTGFNTGHITVKTNAKMLLRGKRTDMMTRRLTVQIKNKDIESSVKCSLFKNQ